MEGQVFPIVEVKASVADGRAVGQHRHNDINSKSR